MKRRDFLKGLGVLAAAPLVGTPRDIPYLPPDVVVLEKQIRDGFFKDLADFQRAENEKAENEFTEELKQRELDAKASLMKAGPGIFLDRIDECDDLTDEEKVFARMFVHWVGHQK